MMKQFQLLKCKLALFLYFLDNKCTATSKQALIAMSLDLNI